MKKEVFLTDLEDLLQREESCSEVDNLGDYDEWDSLSKMAVVAYFGKKFGRELSLNDFSDLKTVSDLMELAGDKID